MKNHSHSSSRLLIAMALFSTALACTPEDSSVRGRGLDVASLSAGDQAQIYGAAMGGSFEVGDPSLSLLLDPRLLPRSVGLAPDGRIGGDVIAELQQRGAIKGTCEPPLEGIRGTPHCTADRPGYVLRFSPVFRLRADSTQVYMYAQAYDTQRSGISQTLRFERAYQVVRHDGAWRAAREGRVPKEVRGEPK